MHQPPLSFFKKNGFFLLALTGILLFLFLVWLRGGFGSVFMDTDLARDLSVLSNMRIHHVVWLGPPMTAGFPASPLYYYVFFAAVVLGNWNANTVVLANIILALSGLGLFALLAAKKQRFFALILTLVIGLTPLWINNSVHPGNGYTYFFWLFLALVSLWYELPLAIAALFFGIAISFHPTALVGLPLLFYEWWRRKHSLRDAFVIGVLLSLPWFPIILFEIITKGYLTRTWLARKPTKTGMKLGFDITNIDMIAHFLGLPLLVAAGAWLWAGITSHTRLRIWFYFASLFLVFFLFIPFSESHYLLGLSSVVLFIILQASSEKKIGRILIVLLATYLLLYSVVFAKVPPSTRSMPKIEGVINTLIQKEKLEKNRAYAVLAILSKDAAVPQADDYRYFLREKGYRALDVKDYSAADRLILFLEVPTFNWQKWSSWETDQFGPRKLIYETKIEGITVLVFKKI